MTPILKAGMVGLDTSHCRAFIEGLHDSSYPYYIPGVQVVGVYLGGSELFSFSQERLPGFASEIESKYHIPVYDDLPRLAEAVDVLFLTSVDGRQHLEQFRQLAVGKPIYIDKPFTTSTTDAAALIQYATATHTPVMSSSSLRFAVGITELAQYHEQIQAVEAFGPLPVLPDYPASFWYGIHSVEMLYLLMGLGCTQVRYLTGEKVDIISGAWPDGRSGVVLGNRYEGYQFGCLVQTSQGAHLGIAADTPPYHIGLLRAIVDFFRTGQSPVDLRETYEIIAFLEAADRSKELGGAPVKLAL